MTSGVLYTGAADGSTVLVKGYALSETPVFVAGGAVVPSIPVVTGQTLGLAQQQYTTLELTIYPGQSQGSVLVYEDDGATMDYLAGACVWTNVSYTCTPGGCSIAVVSSGNFTGFPATRSVVLRLANSVR